MRPSLSRLLTLLTLVTTISAETLLSVVVVSRHGDRTWKGAPPNAIVPATELTTVGQHEMFESGRFYRGRYVAEGAERRVWGIEGERFIGKEVWSSSPDQTLLGTSGLVFLQSLYPPASKPLGSLSALSNGSSIEGPMSGYQYALLHTIPPSSPSTIWLKGDDRCILRDTYLSARGRTPGYLSAELSALEESTKEFYRKFEGLFEGVIPAEDLTFRNAYEIFDYINVGRIHNRKIAESVSEEDFHQLRVLADQGEFSKVWAQSPKGDDMIRSMPGRTISRLILERLETAISKAGKEAKFNLLLTSYDSFLAFFALSGLKDIPATFSGLPNYASSMAFELFTPSNNIDSFPAEDDLQVRFVFRNGTSVEAEEFPLFGAKSVAIPFKDFKSKMEEFAIKDVEQWCEECGSEGKVDFCKRGERVVVREVGGMSRVVAGVVGAMVTLGVVTVITSVWFVIVVRGRKREERRAVERKMAAVREV